ncbi:MAG: hypothetical protein HOD01_12575 [Oceanospirillaceae bacterium]|jgi:CTP synthase (UTP-ammonia lyase)|nr:hypothetical protein [Oceanospirillaceae bacterium]
MKIGLIGDYNKDVTAHVAIPLAIGLASKDLLQTVQTQWINSEDIPLYDLEEFDGLWCVPASPYKNMQNILRAITFSRENDVPFLGTCGGYQHAALEFARNVLGFTSADNGEVNPDAEMPLISALTCKLVDVSDQIQLQHDSQIANIYNKHSVAEEYHCGYGVNRDYLPIYDASDMKFTGFDADNDPRVLEVPTHKFFMGTAFQPERSALKNRSHPIICAFLEAARSA